MTTPGPPPPGSFPSPPPYSPPFAPAGPPPGASAPPPASSPAAGEPVGQFLRPLRDLAVYALAGVPAVLLLTSVLNLFGDDFLHRTQYSFGSFVNLATIFFPLAAVVLALGVQPAHPQARTVTLVALVEYAVAAFFGLVFGVLFGVSNLAATSPGSALLELLVRVAWLALFGLAAYAVWRIWGGLYSAPKPPGGVYGRPYPPYGAPQGWNAPGQPAGYRPPPGHRPGPPPGWQPPPPQGTVYPGAPVASPGASAAFPGAVPAASAGAVPAGSAGAVPAAAGGAFPAASPGAVPAASAGVPVASPGVPASSPGVPASSPGAPVSPPGAPVSPPGAPVSPPGAPVSWPGAPVDGAPPPPFAEPTQVVPAPENRAGGVPSDRPGFGPAAQDPPRQ